MYTTIAAVTVALVLPAVVFGQAMADPPEQWIRISGRVLGPNGAPISNGGLALYHYGTGILADARGADIDGRFSYMCRAFRKYELTATFQALDLVPPKFIEAAGIDIDLGDVRLSPTPDPPVRHPYIELKGHLRLDQIILNSESETHNFREFTNLQIPKERPGATETPTCGSSSDMKVSFDGGCQFRPDITIEQFVGGKVKEIRVVRFWRMAKTTLSDVRDEVRRVWLTPFCCPSPAIGWSEGNFWNVQAIVEFEDGTHRAILMDNWMHVQVQDRNGRFWFIRLRPAVD